MDFIVLDFEVDKEIPIILRKPFIATWKTMRVNDQQVTFNMLEAIKSPDEVKESNFMSVVNLAVTERIDMCCCKEDIKAATFKGFEDDNVVTTQMAWLREK